MGENEVDVDLKLSVEIRSFDGLAGNMARHLRFNEANGALSFPHLYDIQDHRIEPIIP